MDTWTKLCGQTLLDLEDNLGWDKVKPSFSYKQRAWVNALHGSTPDGQRQLVAHHVVELSLLQKLTLQLRTPPSSRQRCRPGSDYPWPAGRPPFLQRLTLPPSSKLSPIFGAACRSEEPPAPDWAVKTEHPPAMPEGCVVVKTEVKTEAKQEVPAWPDDAYVEARVKQEVAQQLAPVVRQGAAGSSSGTTKMQAAPHMRRRPVSPGEASNEESAAPGSAKEGCAKRARTSSSARQVQPDSVGAHGEAAGALG